MSISYRAITWKRWVLAALTLVVAHGVAAHGVSLDVDTPYPAESDFHRQFLVPWAQKIESEAGGRIRLHLHPASTSARATPNLYQQLQEGSLDIIWMPIVPTSTHFPKLGKMPLANRAGGVESLSRGLWDYVRRNDLLDNDFDGVRVLALHYGEVGGLAEDSGASQIFGLFAMSMGSFRSLSDELKAVINANSGPEISAWLARVLSQ